MKPSPKGAKPKAKQPTKVKPSSTKPKTKSSLEVGDTGTRILSGIIREEYNPKLQEHRGIEVFDEMRKSDGSVKAAVLVTSLPIRAAEWYIEPASDDAQDQEIADFATNAMFNWQSITWDDLLRQALLCLPFGVMVFEKVFATRTEGGKTYVVWDKLAPRMPRSIYRWAIGAGNTPGITQWRSDGSTVEIPMEKLVVIVNEMEGENWWGTSILRAAYKHWFIKNNFYKIDAIAFERQGLGVPYVKMPEGYTPPDLAKAEEILKNLRANSQAFIIEPHDYDIGFKDMMARTTRDPQSSITHHNREILKSVLAQFLELGAGSKGASGSRAVSQDHSQLFLASLEAVADTVATTLNKALKELIDLNFNNVQKYPELTYSGISEEDIIQISQSYLSLTQAGAIIPSDNDEQYFRELMNLPDRDPEDLSRAPKPLPKPAASVDDVNADVGMSAFTARLKKNTYPERSEIAAVVMASIADLPLSNAIATLKSNIAIVEQAPATHAKFYSMVKAEMTSTLNALRRRIFADGNTFKSYRPLTLAEEKVNFEALQSKMDQLENDFDTRTKELLHNARADYMAALTTAAHAGDTQAIKDATLKVQADYARIIKQAITAAYTYGKTNAAKEIGVDAPPNPQDMLRQIDIQADTIAEQQIAKIAGDSKNAYVQSLNKGESVTAALAKADTTAAETIDTLTSDTGPILMAGYVNHGRNTVFDRNSDDIYALQRSEVLDAKTCNFCLSVDGRIIATDDNFGNNTIFHSNCRGIWVAILKDEAELPPITGIPVSIRNRLGDAVNELVQPKTPIVRQGTPAAKEAQRRIDKQQEK